MPASPRTPSGSPSGLSHAESDLAPSSQDIFPTPVPKVRWSPPPMRRHEPKRAASTPPEITTQTRTRSMRRGAPGDAPSMASLAISWERQQLSKKRSQYFSDIFAARELRYTPKERVTRDAIIIAELKISSTLDRDTSIVSDFSFHLAQTYQRPESCILLTIQNSTLLVLGGSYEPAYLLSITALQCDIAPRINKRMTGLVQGFLQDSLNIPAKRGVIRFMPIAEENLGTNGMTTLGEIEELVKADHHDPSIRRTISNNRIRRAKKKSLSTIFHGPKIPLLLTPPRSKEDDDDTMVPPYPVATTERKSVKKRRSFLAFFGKSS